MSVCLYAVCADCHVEAPEIGYSGGIGYARLKIEKVTDSDWAATGYSFGWIYDGLRAVNLIPECVEAFRHFLEEHDGHEILAGTDHDSEPAPGVDWSRYCHSGTGFVDARYEVFCEETNDRFRTSATESLMKFQTGELSVADIERFMYRIPDADECFDNFYNTPPCITPYEDLGELAEFFARNQGRKIVAGLVADPS